MVLLRRGKCSRNYFLTTASTLTSCRILAVLEFMEDLKIDYPFACKFVGQIAAGAIDCGKLHLTFLDKAVTFLKESDVDLIACGVASELFIEIVRILSDQVSVFLSTS